MGFEPTDGLTRQLISSQPRYDHFDTSPYLSQHQHLRKRGELMGRTSKNIKLRIPEKPRKIKGFRSGSYRVATTISSRSRYDHFDTSPYKIVGVVGKDVTRFRVISNLLHIRAHRSSTWHLLSLKTIEKSRLFGHSPQENLARKPVPRFLKKAGQKRKKIEDWIDQIFEDNRFSLLSAISRREN